MARLVMLLITLLSFNYCIAQKATRYYDAKWKATGKDEARFYVKFNKEDSLYQAKEFNLKDELQMEGHYTEIPDDLEQHREGIFTYYHTNGTIRKQGLLTNNLKTGLWKSYFYQNGKLKSEEHYDHDSLDGPTVHYNAILGLKQSEGNYLNGKFDGTWKYYSKGMLSSETQYALGKITERKIYNNSGILVKQLSYTNETLVAGKAFDNEGRDIAFSATKEDSTAGVFMYVEQMPRAPYDVNSFIAKNMRYPRKAMKNKTGGRIVIKFVVDEEGNVTDVEAQNHISPEIDAEAIRVVSELPKWIPGKQNGEPVKVYFTLPITFRL